MNNKPIDPQEMDRPLRKIIEALHEISFHSQNYFFFTLAEKDAIAKASNLIAQTVRERHLKEAAL